MELRYPHYILLLDATYQFFHGVWQLLVVEGSDVERVSGVLGPSIITSNDPTLTRS